MLELRKTLGLLGLAAACGPGAPQTSAGPGTTDGPPDDPTSEPPAPTTGPGSETESPTSDPTPECQTYYDCEHLYCGYCDQGICREGVGCCEGHPSPDQAQRWRCTPEPECLDNDDCSEDRLCNSGFCIPIGGELPPCEDRGALIGQWMLGAVPGSFVLADLDGDLDLDLAAAQPSVGRVEIAFNNGEGAFTTVDTVDVGGPSDALWIAAGDLEDDFMDDAALAVVRGDPAGGLILLFGQDSVFTAAPPLPTPPSPSSVLIERVSSGWNDIVVVHPGGVTVRPNDNGEFPLEFVALDGPIDPRPTFVHFDDDGIADLVGTVPGTSTGGIWIHDGGEFVPHVFVEKNPAPSAALLADLDLGPQRPDRPALVFTNGTDGFGIVDVWTDVGPPGAFADPVTYFAHMELNGARLVEFDAPQGPDLVATGHESAVTILNGDGEGHFTCARRIDMPGGSKQALLGVGDLNDDGRIDLVVGHPDSAELTVVFNQ